MDDPSEYFWTHPPKCLSGFTAEKADPAGMILDGHGEPLNTFFALRCQCGHRLGRVVGYKWHKASINEDLFLSPIHWKCSSCGKETGVIDTDIHGYNAELDSSATYRGKGRQEAFSCATCKEESFELVVRFEYSEDLFDEDYDEYAGRQQDLFSWFSLVGRCAGCNQTIQITDFECA